MKSRAICLLTAIVLAVSMMSGCSANKERTVGELLNLGERYLTEQNYEQAIIEFTSLIEIEPNNSRAYIGLAEAYLGMGETDKAIEILSQGLEQIPNDEEIQRQLDELQVGADYVELTQEQLDYLKPLEEAVLALDYEIALAIQSSDEFRELCEGLGQFAIYKTEQEHRWSLFSNQGFYNIDYSPLQDNDGLCLRSSYNTGMEPNGILMHQHDISGHLANGPYQFIQYTVDRRLVVENGTGVNSLIQGETIHTSTEPNGETTVWKFLYENGKVTNYEQYSRDDDIVEYCVYSTEGTDPFFIGDPEMVHYVPGAPISQP